MQTSRFLTFTFAAAAAFILVSCAKNNSQGKLIPREAALVVHVDGKSLSGKLSWDEIKQNPLFKEMNGDTSLPATVKSLLDNPENSGIDATSDLLFFVLKDSIGWYMGFEGKVKDDNTFKSFNTGISENGTQSEKDGVQFISKSPACVGWTKEKFVYIVDAPQLSRMDELTKRMERDSININSASVRDIGATCKSIFTLKEDNTLAADKKFTGLMKENGDVHFWINSEEFLKAGPSQGALAMINLDKFYKGNVTTATMSFENGKMVAKAKTYAGEEMTGLLKKYSGGKLNEDMIKRMPGKDIIAVMAWNFKPELIREIIKMTGLDGLVNMGVQKLGFTTDDFIKAIKGDIFMGVSDLDIKPDTTSFKFRDQEENMSITQKPRVNFVFAASIGDKESFNKLINAGKKLEEGMFPDSSKTPFAYNSNGTYFVISNNRQSTDMYLKSATANLDFISKLGSEPFAGYLDIQLIMKALGTEAGKDSSARVVYEASLKMWDNVIWKGGDFSDGGIAQTIEINLVDKSTNSLKQLNQYVAKMGEVYREQRRKQKNDIMAFDDFESQQGEQARPPEKTK